MDQIVDINLVSDDSKTISSSQLVTYKENPIREVSLLTKDFDLSSMPPNYMRRRSKIEEIIYRAVFSQNNHKSPFASFKIAKNCLLDIDKIDIVTGINNLKKIIKAIYSNNEQISIMVHKVADTYLLDEFDLDALFLRHQHYADWDWLRNFIKQESFQLAKPDISRSSLSMRDLYAKFLYHSVSQPSIEMAKSDIESFQTGESSSQLSVIEKPVQLKMESTFSGTNHRFDSKNEDFLNLVDWKLEDLSFVVGSDLSIFGTKSHPCISLRLNPSREPINILTGIDMWLENMLNEVPEVAMCYHDQGIVMREYEILKTDDIPKLASFNEEEVKSIAKNLSHFLSTNATKEGHTYWLFKEADSTTVKLYDLTNIWENEQTGHNIDINNKGQIHGDNNPFIIPVAVLCYRMAENRVNQWYRAREKRGKTKLTSSQFNKELLDNKLADNQYYFNEIFRLLKNCINLLIKTGKHQELVTKATLMMCRLYLEVDQTTRNNLQQYRDTESNNISKLDLNDLKRENLKLSSNSVSITGDSVINDISLIGSQLYEHCTNKNTQEIFEQAIKLIELNDFNDQPAILTDNELLSCNTLLCDHYMESGTGSMTTTENRQITIKENLTYSVIMHYICQSIDKDIAKASVDDLKIILKSGFMVALLDEEVLSNGVKLSREHDFYYSLIRSFLKWHIDLQGAGDSSNSVILSNFDKKVLSYHYDKRNEQFLSAMFVFKSVFMPEKERVQLNIKNKVHQGWYQAILYLTSLAYKLSKLSLDKTKSHLIQRGMPIFLNFLVGAIVNVYQQKSMTTEDMDAKEAHLSDWCQKTVLPSIKWISEWTDSHDFDVNLEEGLVALVWSNKAKLFRLAAAIIRDRKYNYLAIDAYSDAIDTLTKLGKKKPSQMSINIKCDRLDLCMMIVEDAYSSMNDNKDEHYSIAEMNQAVECAEKVHRMESSLQSIPIINNKLISLRLRINFVRYYLNLKSNPSLNHDQIFNDLQNDLSIILKRDDSLSRCKELTLIQFYMFKIQVDRCEILSTDSIRKFVADNRTILNGNLLNGQFESYFENDGKSLIAAIYTHLIVILRHLIRKCRSVETYRKKKQQMNMSKVVALDSYLADCGDETAPHLSTLELLKNLLTKTEYIL